MTVEDSLLHSARCLDSVVGRSRSALPIVLKRSLMAVAVLSLTA